MGTMASTAARSRRQTGCDDHSDEGGDDPHGEKDRHERAEQAGGQGGRERRGPRAVALHRRREPGDDERQQDVRDDHRHASLGERSGEDAAGPPGERDESAAPAGAGGDPRGEVCGQCRQRHRDEDQPRQGHAGWRVRPSST